MRLDARRDKQGTAGPPMHNKVNHYLSCLRCLVSSVACRYAANLTGGTDSRSVCHVSAHLRLSAIVHLEAELLRQEAWTVLRLDSMIYTQVRCQC